MKTIQIAIAVLQLINVAYAQTSENCSSGYRIGSAEQNACRARNDDRATQERRYKENQEESRALQQKAERDLYYESKKREDAQRLERLLGDQEQQSRDKEKQKLNEGKQMEILGDIVAMTEFAAKPNIKRADALSKAGKCKESRDAIQQGYKNESKRTQGMMDLMTAYIAEGCDKDNKLALKYYFKSADNGSIVGKVALDDFVKRQGKN